MIAFAALAVVIVNKLDSMDSRDSSRPMLIQDEARKLLLVPLSNDLCSEKAELFRATSGKAELTPPLKEDDTLGSKHSE